MNRRMFAGVLSIAFIGAICARWPAQAAPPAAAPKSAAAEIKDLRQQRIELLGHVVKIATSHYQAGIVEFHELCTYQRAWYQAQLDAAETSQQRIVILDEFERSADTLRKIADMRFQNGATSVIDADLAKAQLLEVKIMLLREREAATAKKK